MRRLTSLTLVAALAGVFGACGSGNSGGGAAAANPASPSTSAPVSAAASSEVSWSYDGQTWRSSGAAPACASPLTFSAPVDLSRATAVLYPGQSRPDYKPHGGFRFDGPGQTNDVAVVAPMDGTIYRGARFLVSGEIQYTFDIINSCGIMHRLGHLRALSPRFQAIADAFPAATEGDSRTTNAAPGQRVSAGETVATAVGLRAGSNVFVDWGVFDLRARNAASVSGAWLAQHGGELEPYGICWIDNLPAGDGARVRSLPPGDPTAGTTSDYCR